MMPWLLLVMAGILEVGWAMALKLSEGFTRPVPGLVGLAMAALSLLLLAIALRSLPVSVAYTVWVGIGMGGVAIYGLVMLGEPAGTFKLFSIAAVCCGIIGLVMSES